MTQIGTFIRAEDVIRHAAKHGHTLDSGTAQMLLIEHRERLRALLDTHKEVIVMHLLQKAGYA